LDDAFDSLGDVLASAMMGAADEAAEMAALAILPPEVWAHPSAMHPDAGRTSGGASTAAAGHETAQSAGGDAPSAASAVKYVTVSDGFSSYALHAIVLPKAVYVNISGPAASTSGQAESKQSSIDAEDMAVMGIVDTNATVGASRAAEPTCRMGSLLVATPPLPGSSYAEPSVSTILHGAATGSVELESSAHRLTRRLKRMVLLSGEFPDTPDSSAALSLIERAIVKLVEA
jgi:hypothetical protein